MDFWGFSPFHPSRRPDGEILKFFLASQKSLSHIGRVSPLVLIGVQKFSIIYSRNPDEPQPKRLTGENRANREGGGWKILFSFLISVCSVFSVLKIVAFFAHILLVRDYHLCHAESIFFIVKNRAGLKKDSSRMTFFPTRD